jgi:hypothetical protein
MVGFLMIAVALPRLPFFPAPPIVYPLGILPQEAFGWLFLVIGLGLLATGSHCRTRFRGRMVALLALVAWSVLAAATTSLTSVLIDVVVMWAMLGEITAARDDEC